MTYTTNGTVGDTCSDRGESRDTDGDRTRNRLRHGSRDSDRLTLGRYRDRGIGRDKEEQERRPIEIQEGKTDSLKEIGKDALIETETGTRDRKCERERE